MNFLTLFLIVAQLIAIQLNFLFAQLLIEFYSFVAYLRYCLVKAFVLKIEFSHYNTTEPYGCDLNVHFVQL